MHFFISLYIIYLFLRFTLFFHSFIISKHLYSVSRYLIRAISPFSSPVGTRTIKTIEFKRSLGYKRNIHENVRQWSFHACSWNYGEWYKEVSYFLSFCIFRNKHDIFAHFICYWPSCYNFRHYLVPLSLAQKSKWRKKGTKLHIFNDHTFIAKHMAGWVI